MVGYIVPYMEPPISPSTVMDFTTVGRTPKAAAPLLWRQPKAASIMVDGEFGGSINGTIYPTISGSKKGAEIDNHSGKL